jgi:hypothetical protein
MKGVVLVLGLVIIGGALLIALRMVVGTWQIAATRKSEAALTGAKDYRGLAEEYRRLAEMAVTAQEHTDLRLGQVTSQIDHMRDQLDSVQRILKDVE